MCGTFTRCRRGEQPATGMPREYAGMVPPDGALPSRPGDDLEVFEPSFVLLNGRGKRLRARVFSGLQHAVEWAQKLLNPAMFPGMN